MQNEDDASKHPHKRAVHVEKAVRIGTTYNVVNEIRRHPQLYKAFPSAPTFPSAQRVNAHTLTKLRTTHIDSTARRSCMHPQALHELERTDSDKREQLTTQNETHACRTQDRTRLHVVHHT